MTHLAIIFYAASQVFNLPPGLLESVCLVESNHNPKAFVSHDGGSASHGICQVKLGTANLLGFKGQPSALQEPELNALFAAKYLRRNLDRYSGDVYKAIAAYNAGKYLDSKTYPGKAVNDKYVQKVYSVWLGSKK